MKTEEMEEKSELTHKSLLQALIRLTALERHLIKRGIITDAELAAEVDVVIGEFQALMDKDGKVNQSS